MRRLTIRLPDEDLARLEAVARLQGVTPSEAARRGLQSYTWEVLMAEAVPVELRPGNGNAGDQADELVDLEAAAAPAVEPPGDRRRNGDRRMPPEWYGAEALERRAAVLAEQGERRRPAWPERRGA